MESELTEQIYTLKSVDCVLSSLDGMVRPLLSDGTTDLDDVGTPINEVTDEWVDKLSDEDVLKVANIVDEIGISNGSFPVEVFDYKTKVTKGILKSVLKLK
ncbi:hypothetical protein HOE22_07655 [Candidatus Woesearchaeota archaeon]|jgi:hypothetical protein|nr:hypothetical protein [Candidatus Woesearchaeota archaeon]MBT7555464.1 hypothetical protein [Candidatus Woesearchaeota archaeon]